MTPETWESNNYPAEMFANDPIWGERARKQVEAAPLPVKIRYLVEYMASDHRADFGRLDVPVLALKPGFNEKLFADPAYGWFKAGFQDAWDGFPKRPRFELIEIPDARALMLDDQPTLTDRAIATFVEANSKSTALEYTFHRPRRIARASFCAPGRDAGLKARATCFLTSLCTPGLMKTSKEQS